MQTMYRQVGYQDAVQTKPTDRYRVFFQYQSSPRLLLAGNILIVLLASIQ